MNEKMRISTLSKKESKNEFMKRFIDNLREELKRLRKNKLAYANKKEKELLRDIKELEKELE